MSQNAVAGVSGGPVIAGGVQGRNDFLRFTPVTRTPADLPGYDLKPNPMSARSAADLIKALREHKIWAGDVSFRVMARAAGQQASAAAICVALGDAALSRNELPRLPVVIAVVAGCGGDADEQAAWATAWRLLRTGRRPAEARRPLRSVAAG